MFQDEQTRPGARAIKLSEPMWTSFFELHTGRWRISAHNMRPDTRAIEAPSQPNRLKITLQNWGHPHTTAAATAFSRQQRADDLPLLVRKPNPLAQRRLQKSALSQPATPLSTFVHDT